MMVWSTPLTKYRETDGIKVNRSHAAAYALIAYQEAWLKTYYPKEFFTALLSVYADNETKIASYVEAANEMGIEVSGPDINLSDNDFSISPDGRILWGFGAIKSLKNVTIDAILAQRPFDSLEEILIKFSKKEADKTSLAALAYSGALDAFDPEQHRLNILASALAMRGDFLEDLQAKLESYDKVKQYQLEREFIGIYLTGHPLEEVAQPVDWEEALRTEHRIQTFAMVHSIRQILTKKGDPMAFIQLSCMDNHLDTVCFPNLWQNSIQFQANSPLVPLSALLKEGMVVKFTGRYETKEGRTSFLLNDIKIPVRQNKAFHEHILEVEVKEGVFPEKEPEAPRLTPTDFEAFINFQD